MSQSAGEIPTEQEAALAEQGKKKAKVKFSGIPRIFSWGSINCALGSNLT